MPKATTGDGVELFYEVRGNPSASNKVVFIMGHGGNHRGWDLQSHYFSALPDYQILVFDNRGAGFSNSPTTPYTMDIMANDAVFLTNIVGFHRFHLVGVSMGGMIAQHVALLVPERIISLTLMVTRVVGGIFNNLPTLKGLLKLQKMKTAAKEDDAEAVMDAGAELLFPHAYLESRAENGQTQMEALRDMVAQRSKEVPATTEDGKKYQFGAVKGHGLTPAQLSQLKHAKFPILAIVGDQDALMRPYHSYHMPDQIGADLLIIEGAGHGVMQQAPELVNYHIKQHCDHSVSGASRNPTPKTTTLPYTYKYHAAGGEQVKQQAEAAKNIPPVV